MDTKNYSLATKAFRNLCQKLAEDQLMAEELHELDIQNMSTERIAQKLAVSDLPHREGK